MDKRRTSNRQIAEQVNHVANIADDNGDKLDEVRESLASLHVKVDRLLVKVYVLKPRDESEV